MPFTDELRLAVAAYLARGFGPQQSTPIGTPPASHKMAAPTPIESDTGTSLIICGHTGSWLRKE